MTHQQVPPQNAEFFTQQQYADSHSSSAESATAAQPRLGVRLAVDVGMARVGIARSDTAGIMALPVATVTREKDDFSTVKALIDEYNVLEIYVGLPLNMDGSVGKSAKAAQRWAKRLQRMLQKSFAGFAPEIRMVDERLSTVLAHQQLQQAGRREITHRSVIDQQAAVLILENALAYERKTGQIPGKLCGI